MDYLVIGSIGFAQVGSDEYYVNRKIENQILMELVRLEPIFKVPFKFKDICNLKLKTFQHDFGAYDELCLIYDFNKLDEFDDEIKEKFHDWTSELESYDFEQEIILKYCKLKKKKESCSLLLKKEQNNQKLIINYH